MNEIIRVRFAPSPTGYLHIGGVRTALFNWLFARHHKGRFILRIEDTDISRSTDESIKQIIEGLTWLSIDWDEGPFRQTERRDIYIQHIERLLKEGKAYRCYCTPDELEQKRKEALAKGEKPKYDGHCRNLDTLPAGRPWAVRFKTSMEGNTIVEDLLRGKVVFDNKELDDLIILRSDGIPTYNFVVVVDDATMKITHVIRGDDHLSNTPRQVQLYHGLGYQPPRFLHLSMILGSDKTRLSKRHGATSILSYRDMGYLPEAMVNYLVRLGWSYGDQEIFSKEELIEKFSIENIGKSSAVFNPEKLLWLNSHYIKNGDSLYLASHLIPHLLKEGILSENKDSGISIKEIAKVIPSLQERSKTLIEMAKGADFFFDKEIQYDENGAKRFLTPSIIPIFEKLIDMFERSESFDTDSLKRIFTDITEKEGVELGKIAQPVRLALTGKTVSPGIFDVISLLGQDRVIERLKKGIRYIQISLKRDLGSI
ncbi:MAG: glutamate--tRNA ligase [Nitrospinae bacterium]|nr:glutamate--tRNA ligase [Nitrospinota bacterium]